MLSEATTIVTVSYNSAAVLGAMLASARGQAGVVVVDNGGADGVEALALSQGAASVRLARNEGFGRGCNAGAAQAGGEFLFFVNPDVVLAEGCVDALEQAARRLPGFVAANPLVRDGRGRVTFKTTSVLLPKGGARRPVPVAETGVPVLTGCALFVRRDAFWQVGGFDPAIFLYHEDHDLALRLARLGGLWWVPAAEVRHVAGTGAPRSAAVARLKGYHMARSRGYAMHKHGRSLPYARTLAGAVLGLLAPHNLLDGRRRSRVMGQIAGAVSAFRDRGVYTPE